MSKKTGFQKVLGRTDYVVVARVNKLTQAPFKEVVTVLDFTQKR